jgi:hypothetical protein
MAKNGVNFGGTGSMAEIKLLLPLLPQFPSTLILYFAIRRRRQAFCSRKKHQLRFMAYLHQSLVLAVVSCCNYKKDVIVPLAK